MLSPLSQSMVEKVAACSLHAKAVSARALDDQPIICAIWTSLLGHPDAISNSARCIAWRSDRALLQPHASIELDCREGVVPLAGLFPSIILPSSSKSER